MAPRVSVIIPYYEGQRWLPLSAAGVLAQQGAELELIVVDDGSSEPASAAMLPPDPRLRFIAITHSGKGAAVNRGVKEARGEAVCVLDQDDIMLPGRLAAQLAALDADPDADAVYSDYERATEDGKRLDVFTSRQASNREMLHAMASATGLISMQTMLIRKSALERLGGFSEDPVLNGLDDGEFFARLIASGARLVHVPGLYARWVSHAGNYSRQAGFNEARLTLLSRLSELAGVYPMLTPELKFFRTHAHYMRGLFFLEGGRPCPAMPEFAAALRAWPFNLGAWYLLVKSALLSAAGGKS